MLYVYISDNVLVYMYYYNTVITVHVVVCRLCMWCREIVHHRPQLVVFVDPACSVC